MLYVLSAGVRCLNVRRRGASQSPKWPLPVANWIPAVRFEGPGADGIASECNRLGKQMSEYGKVNYEHGQPHLSAASLTLLNLA